MVLTTKKEVLLFALKHVGLLNQPSTKTKVKENNTSTQVEKNTHVMPARQVTNASQPEKSSMVEQQKEKLNGTPKESQHTTTTQTKPTEENNDSKSSKQQTNSSNTDAKQNTKPKIPVPPGSSVFPPHLFQNLKFIPGFLPFNFANLYAPLKPNGQQGKDSKDNGDNKTGLSSTVINPLLMQLANNAAVKKASQCGLLTGLLMPVQQVLQPEIKKVTQQIDTDKKSKDSLSGPDILDMLLNSSNTMKVIQPRPKPKPTPESIELAKQLLDIVAKEQIKQELINYISSATDNELTDRALKIHKNLYASKETPQKPTTTGDETDLSTDESDDDHLDLVR